MKKETDLGGVKAIANALLMTAVNQTPYSPMLVQHPFTSTGLVALPSEKYEGFRPIDITLNNENLQRWQNSVNQVIDETENPYHIYMLLNPPYALTFLKLASSYLSRKDFSEILASAWINCEAPHNDPDLSKADLLFMFKSADPKALMEDEEYEQLQELEDTLTVYRVRNGRVYTKSARTADGSDVRYGLAIFGGYSNLGGRSGGIPCWRNPENLFRA